jgi:hypothetical protein
LLYLLVALSAFACRGRADDDGDSVVFDLRTAAGTTLSGTLKEIGTDWSVRLRPTRPALIKAAQVISLRRKGKSLPALPVTSQVVLANGGRVPGDLLEIADDRLLFNPGLPLKTPNNLAWSIPLTAVAVVWLAAPDQGAEPEQLLRRLAQGQRTQDVLLRKNGDKIEGTLKGLKADTFRIEVKGKEVVEVGKDKVAALAFNTELVSRARPRGIYGHLVLVNGCRMAITAARVEDAGTMLWGKLPFGDSFTVPLEQVAALDYRHGCGTYLSDLKPKSYRHTPFLGESWPYVADGSVANRPLRLASGTHDKGLGMHSRSQLTYAVPEGTRFFEAVVGFDDVTGKRGRARVQVLLDGTPADIGRTRDLTARDKPLAVRVDVSRARELTLVVDFGRRGDVQAHVNWVDARFIK